jgi:hypothetical protein
LLIKSKLNNLLYAKNTLWDSLLESRYLLASAVGGPLVSDTRVLARSELVHAGVIDIVHEVGGRIISRIAGARVNGTRATVVGLLLSRSIINTITTSERVASTLEGVVETHPVTNFVGSSVTFVVLKFE